MEQFCLNIYTPQWLCDNNAAQLSCYGIKYVSKLKFEVHGILTEVCGPGVS